MSDLDTDLREYFDALTRRMVETPAEVGTQAFGETLRRPRRTLGYVVLALGVAACVIAAALLLAGGDDARRVRVAAGGRFVPPVSREGGRTVLPLVFPDGSSVELVYPAGVDLAGLGFTPGAAVDYPDYPKGDPSPSPCCGRGLEISHGPLSGALGAAAPTKVYRGAGGQPVPFYDSSGLNVFGDSQLAFHFGSWTVLTFDYRPGQPDRGERMTEQQRATFAASLDGHEDRHGFLVLDAHSPLCLGPVDGPDGILGDPGPGAKAWLYFDRPRGNAEPPATYTNRRGYRIQEDAQGITMAPPGDSFELHLAPELRSLRDTIEIRNVRDTHGKRSVASGPC